MQFALSTNRSRNQASALEFSVLVFKIRYSRFHYDATKDTHK